MRVQVRACWHLDDTPAQRRKFVNTMSRPNSGNRSGYMAAGAPSGGPPDHSYQAHARSGAHSVRCTRCDTVLCQTAWPITSAVCQGMRRSERTAQFCEQLPCIVQLAKLTVGVVQMQQEAMDAPESQLEARLFGQGAAADAQHAQAPESNYQNFYRRPHERRQGKAMVPSNISFQRSHVTLG